MTKKTPPKKLEKPSGNTKAKRSAKREPKAVPEIVSGGVINGHALRQELTTIARQNMGREGELRKQALALMKRSLVDGQKQIQNQFEAGAFKGDRCSAKLSDLMDELLTALNDFTLVHVLRLANPTDEERVTVIAVGGYGRGNLAPHSDVDLLFLLPYKRNATSEQFVEYILYMLWDMGLKVGHSTRSIRDCVVQALEDMTVRTAMLEARFLCGNLDFFGVFRKTFETKVMKGTVREFVAAKLDERDNRHETSGRSRYLVEPNLKESKGGLRDLNTLFWIARYCYNVQELDDLVAKKLLTAKELKLFRGCAQFLWSVRCHLHFMAGRAEERLSFDVQQELTLRMRVKGSKGLNPIESFMRQYFLVAKDVGDLTAIFCAALEEEQNKKGRLARLPALFRRQQNVQGFTIDNGRLSLSRKDLFERDPVSLIRVFAIADKYKLDIHPNTMREMTRSLNLINADLRSNDEANQLFLQILTSKKSPERTLRRMNEAGVLGRFITDFGRIVALMQFNMYHHYTADEHLLRAIGILSEIDTGALASEHAISHQLMKQDINRRVLYLAVLLHDIAKGRPEDHSIAGAKIARRLGPRLGFTPDETALTEWLVEHHFVMSDVAQRRDLSDHRTIQDFVAFVQTTENLKHLMVLTVVDIRAVGPGVWNSWKAQLIHELYHEAEAVITAGGSMAKRTVRVAAAQRNLEALLVGWSKAEIKKYLGRHQDAYWLNVDLPTQLRHANLMRRPLSKPMIVDFNFDETRDATELTVVAEDHPGLFARLTGACAVAGLNILDARITTTRDGLAVDTLYVQEFEISGELTQHRMEKIVETIYDVMYGKIEPPDNLAKRSFGKKLNAFHLTPKVQINNDLSDQSTVIEVSGIDRPGLLYSLSNDLFEQSVSLVAARVATFGERAVDVFYVTDTLGGKITNGSKRARLINRLKAIIADPAISGSAKKPADKPVDKPADKVA